ncbi:MAG: DUF305 domain-containing protein [Pseudomonadota bacterium]|nr:MAG: DUF305 domain-containing protein [Pseudomonadota bacterium]
MTERRFGRWAILPAVCSLLVLTLVGHAGDTSDAHAAFARAMHTGMVRMMTDMEQAPMIGDPDHDFLAMMIPHHEGAVEMARLQLLHGRDPLVRRLAEEIIASQQSEIVAMRARLEILRSRRQGDPDEFPPVHGLRGGADAAR